MDQYIYHLKIVGKQILFMLLYFKIFFQRNRGECHIFNSLPLFLYLGSFETALVLTTSLQARASISDFSSIAQRDHRKL